MKRIQKEFIEAQKQSELYSVKQVGSLLYWEMEFIGPKQTPYQGGIFRVQIKFPTQYPFRFPEVKFITPIWHPNIKQDGQICRQMIGQKQWLPNKRFITVIHTLLGMVTHPNLDYAINLNALNDIKQGTYFNKARQLTKKHAIKK